ncbi:hypothetical protein EVA_04615 [gut metagenome]|uniref:Uncharacterized protein n=1 Tax=gut metagenome TaxID=749906 RepID=J9GI82_9ZZZZ
MFWSAFKVISLVWHRACLRIPVLSPTLTSFPLTMRRDRIMW